MPVLNTWTPRQTFLGQTLQHYSHNAKVKDYARTRARQFGHELGTAYGAAAGVATSAGINAAKRFGSWYYPSSSIYVRNRAALARKTFTLTKTKRKRKPKKKTCCRYVKGKKVCKPEYCAKKKYWH